ncbi:hypothetical protein ABEB36_004061 [Hypothenemus hampei]|uniref:Tc1-like transposase DDE domain-containing protein n=1 Tax=Hypothenemus hampei TaxID=57062 RepID=A0ABD1F2D8_HYPHA
MRNRWYGSMRQILICITDDQKIEPKLVIKHVAPPASRNSNTFLTGHLRNRLYGTSKWFIYLRLSECMNGQSYVPMAKHGNQLENSIIVCDNAKCHTNLKVVIEEAPTTLLSLVAHSPMFNPIEFICAKLKCYAKTLLRILEVSGSGVGK